jgi:hypothetical protein
MACNREDSCAKPLHFITTQRDRQQDISLLHKMCVNLDWGCCCYCQGIWVHAWSHPSLSQNLQWQYYYSCPPTHPTTWIKYQGPFWSEPVWPLVLLRKFESLLILWMYPWLNLIWCKVLVKDNPDEQILGTALKAVSLVRDWLCCEVDGKLMRWPKLTQPFRMTRWWKTPYFKWE